MKHSPGPWAFEARNMPIADTGDYDGAWFVTDAEDERVVEIWEGRRPIEQDEANARLIAAAPELLAALQDVLKIADRKHDAFDRAHAAIKAATSSEDSAT